MPFCGVPNLFVTLIKSFDSIPFYESPHLLLGKNTDLMISPVLQFLGRFSRRHFSLVPRRLSVKWDNLKIIAPALKNKGEDKYKWMEVELVFPIFIRHSIKILHRACMTKIGFLFVHL